MNFITTDTNALFAMKDKIPINEECISYRASPITTWSNSQLSKVFFSKENIHFLQNNIFNSVKQMSNGSFTRCNLDFNQLKENMNRVLTNYSNNNPYCIPENIQERLNALNQLTLETAINQSYYDTQAYNQYMHDINNLVVPMDRPVQVPTCKNDKQLINTKGWM